MEINDVKTMWNSMTPADRISKMGASKNASRKTWDALGVMAQMLVLIPIDIRA